MITSVAIRKDGVIYSLPKPSRHHDVIKLMVDIGLDLPVTKGSEQGFLTSDDLFLDRETAAWFALNLGQCTKLIAPPKLYSEDLW